MKVGTCQAKKIKEYDSVTIHCQYLDDNDLPLSLADIQIKAELRGISGKLVDTLEVTIDDLDNGRFTLRPTVSPLPVGALNADALFTKHGKRVSSETFTITVHPAVT